MICPYGASRSSISPSCVTAYCLLSRYAGPCPALPSGKTARHLSHLPSSFITVTARRVSVRRQLVTKTYNARLGTRITENVDTRLRQLALVRRRRLSHVLDDVPGAALPTAEDLRAQLARLAGTGRQARHGHR